MKGKATNDNGTHTPAGGDERIEALYDVPPVDFVVARNQLAAALKREGKKSEAELVRAMAKPSPSAFATNQLARQHPKELATYLEAAEKLRASQIAGTPTSAAGFKAETVAQRAAFDRLVNLGEAILGEAKASTARAVVEKLANNLRFSVLTETGRDALRTGRLNGDLEPPDFSEILAAIPLRTREESGRSDATGAPPPAASDETDERPSPGGSTLIANALAEKKVRAEADDLRRQIVRAEAELGRIEREQRQSHAASAELVKRKAELEKNLAIVDEAARDEEAKAENLAREREAAEATLSELKEKVAALGEPHKRG